MKVERRKQLQGFVRKEGLADVDLALLDLALTHPSYFSDEQGNRVHNQRLEFLGDAVLDLIIGEYLYQQFPRHDEGELSKMRASLVCEESLAGSAKRLGLDKLLLIGRGEKMTGGAKRASNLADAWEALAGALYLSQGIEVIKPLVLGFLDEEIDAVEKGYYGDYKTRLQEYVQKQPGDEVHYRLLKEEGPDHNKVFSSAVLVNGKVQGTGVGKTKKISEQKAAFAALVKYGEFDD